MSISITLPPAEAQSKPRITVFGVGGAGCNAVSNMIRSNLEGVEFVVANTDSQALHNAPAGKKVQLGSTITRGLGAGARPDVGRAAAEEQLDEITSQLAGTNMCFITAGMGGGTGTGAAPVVARAAREQGILTVGVVTKPFHFEGQHRMRIAEQGVAELAQFVDTLIIIPNQNLFRIANEKTTFADAFKMADDVLYAGVRGVTDLMVMPGLINLDFADIRTVMTEMGKAMMGTGEATGDRRALDAAEAAISNPLLDDVSMKGARGVLINITGGYDMTLFEVDEAANRIRDEVDPEANIIFGSTFDANAEGRIRVSVVATGIERIAAAQPRPAAMPQLTVVQGRGGEVPRRAVAGGGGSPRPFGPGTPAPAPAPVPGGLGVYAALSPAPLPHHGEMVEEVLADDLTPAPAANALETAPESRPAYAPDPEPAAVARAPAGPLRGERRDGAFIAPRPADGGPRVPTADRGPAADPRRRSGGMGLFGKVTGLFGGSEAEPAPRANGPAPAAYPTRSLPPMQPGAGGTVVATPPTRRPLAPEEDVLEIPAFLRRQAN